MTWTAAWRRVSVNRIRGEANPRRTVHQRITTQPGQMTMPTAGRHPPEWRAIRTEGRGGISLESPDDATPPARCRCRQWCGTSAAKAAWAPALLSPPDCSARRPRVGSPRGPGGLGPALWVGRTGCVEQAAGAQLAGRLLSARVVFLSSRHCRPPGG